MKKETISLLIATLLLSSIFAGAIYVILGNNDEILATGEIGLIEYPPIYEELPQELTFALKHRDTGETYYLAYQNETLVQPKDAKYLDLIYSEVTIHGKLRYMNGIEDKQKYLIIIVLEISKI